MNIDYRGLVVIMEVLQRDRRSAVGKNCKIVEL